MVMNFRSNSNKVRKSSDRILFFAFLALFLWLPLPFGSNTVWAISIMEIWVFSLSIAWLVQLARNKVYFNSTFQKSHFVLLIFLCFVLWVFIQSIPLPANIVAILSPETYQIYKSTYQIIDVAYPSYIPLSLSKYHSYSAFQETLSYFLIFCLTFLLVRNSRRLRLFAIIIIISGIIQAVYGSVMTLSGLEYSFFQEKTSYRNLATGTFVNRNHLAGYLEMCLAIGIGFYLSTLHTTQSVSKNEFLRRMINNFLEGKIQVRIGLVIMVIALVLTHSRMGNSAFFFSAPFMGILFFIIVKNPPHGTVFLFASILIIDILIVGAWFGIDKVAQRLENTSASRETRDEVVRDTITMIKDYPITGSGGGTYNISFLRYRGDDISGYYDHAHNDYLEFLAEYGFIGMSLLILLVMSSLLNAFFALYRRKKLLFQSMAYSSAMGIIAILIHSLVDFNLQIPANASLFVVLLALGHISLKLKTHSHH